MQQKISALQIEFETPNVVDQEIPVAILPTDPTQSITQWKLTHSPAGIPHVYVNGVRQLMGSDNTCTGDTLTSPYWGLLTSPLIVVDYIY